MIIYLAINLLNGMPYVGKTTKILSERLKFYKRAEKSQKKLRYFENAIRKYGLNNFEFIMIDKADTYEELNQKEKYWIKYHQSYHKELGYNLTFGGDGSSPGIRWSPETEFKKGQKPWNMGKQHSEETKLKLSQANKGKLNKKNSIIIKEKIARGSWVSPNKGRKYNKEERLRISSRMKESGLLPPIEKRFKLGNIPWNKGSPHSEETKKKIGESKRGVKCLKHSIWMKNAIKNGFKPQLARHSKETKQKISKSLAGKKQPIKWKKIKCVETGIIYESVTEAANKNKLFTTNLAKTVQGKHKTCGGYHWEYINKEKENV